MPPETPEAQQSAFPVEKIRTALLGYRIMAWTTGLWLIALCYEIVSHLVLHHEIRWIEVVHGWVYFAYVLTAFNLAIKVALADRQDHRRAAQRHYSAAGHHRRALPDQGRQGALRAVRARA